MRMCRGCLEEVEQVSRCKRLGWCVGQTFDASMPLQSAHAAGALEVGQVGCSSSCCGTAAAVDSLNRHLGVQLAHAPMLHRDVPPYYWQCGGEVQQLPAIHSWH
jgi:hypothetical protein